MAGRGTRSSWGAGHVLLGDLGSGNVVTSVIMLKQYTSDLGTFLRVILQ